ncbi:hypothetical protein NQP46_29690 [Streptomyces albus]|nr:hypothetical protein NQP46_29690 [Streptomyces albus]
MKWGAGWAGAGVWAAGFAAFSSLTPHRVWGASAAVGYVGAALAAAACCADRAHARPRSAPR